MKTFVFQQQRTASFLLVLWALICLSNVVFRHSHRMPDGRVITHVHPYAEFGSKCPFPNHHHSQSELSWLDCISNIPFDFFTPLIGIEVFLYKIRSVRAFLYIESKAGQKYSTLFLRGPPSL